LVFTVTSFPPLIRRIVENDAKFRNSKIPISDLFKKYDAIRDEVTEYLENLTYHKMRKVRGLYKSILCINFPNDLSTLGAAIEIRHDIVHRNGKNKQGKHHDLNLTSVTDLLKAIKAFVDIVDPQVKNVYPKMLEKDS